MPAGTPGRQMPKGLMPTRTQDFWRFTDGVEVADEAIDVGAALRRGFFRRGSAGRRMGYG